MKPVKWYIHKYPCEFWYWLHCLTRIWDIVFPLRRYHYHLHELCATGYNLYGQCIGINEDKYSANTVAKYKMLRQKITAVNLT